MLSFTSIFTCQPRNYHPYRLLLDIHSIGRTSITLLIPNRFVVTPLILVPLPPWDKTTCIQWGQQLYDLLTEIITRTVYQLTAITSIMSPNLLSVCSATAKHHYYYHRHCHEIWIIRLTTVYYQVEKQSCQLYIPLRFLWKNIMVFVQNRQCLR